MGAFQSKLDAKITFNFVCMVNQSGLWQNKSIDNIFCWVFVVVAVHFEKENYFFFLFHKKNQFDCFQKRDNCFVEQLLKVLVHRSGVCIFLFFQHVGGTHVSQLNKISESGMPVQTFSYKIE